MLNSLILLGGLVSSLGLSAIQPNCNIEEKQEVVSNVNPKYVEYNDSLYYIRFTYLEFSTYHWDNLFSYFVDETLFGYIHFVFNNNNDLTYEGNYIDNEGMVLFNDGDDNLSLIYNNTLYNYAYAADAFNYQFITELDGISLDDDDDVVLGFLSNGSTYYSGLKSAIELDIQANQTNSPKTLGFV